MPLSKSAEQIDSVVQIVTPENIAFQYQIAGPFRRLPAYVLDLVIRWIVLVGVWFVCMLAGVALGAVVIAVFLVVNFLLEWFYGGAFESLMNGQTPGKWAMGVRVLSVDGKPVNGIQAVLRNVLRFADMMPWLSLQIISDYPVYIIPSFVLGLVTMTMSKRFQRLGDLVCGTIVVVEQRQWLAGVAQLEDQRTAQLASYIPMDFRVSRSLALAVSAYVDRRRFFTEARRREVARHLAEPLLERFGFPSDTSFDLLLCAVYYRAFVADNNGSDESATGESSPFGFPSSAPGQTTKQGTQILVEMERPA